MNSHGKELRRQLDEGDGGTGAATTQPRDDEERLTTADMAAGAGSQRREREDHSGPVGHGDEDRPAPLFPQDRADEHRSHWRAVQTAFVDDPRTAVEDADALVARVMKELAETFAQERSQLESQWGRGDDVSTEDLRIALRRYRSFFDRLLEI
jgi:hypothetical protein